jgi:hypothetical protein
MLEPYLIFITTINTIIGASALIISLVKWRSFKTLRNKNPNLDPNASNNSIDDVRHHEIPLERI